MNNCYIYFFGVDEKLNIPYLKQSIKNSCYLIDKEQKINLLGGKGAGLYDMYKLGLRIPPGFTITTELCDYYYKNNYTLPEDFDSHLKSSLSVVEDVIGRSFGSNINPLLLSVRSGAPVSMPGMMDTILNLGINDSVCDGLSNTFKNRAFVLDCYKRFLEMYATVVLELPSYLFTDISLSLESYGSVKDNVQVLENTINKFKEVIIKHNGSMIPDDPIIQLKGAIKAVLRSWNNHRAILYRKLHGISDSLGTAINVQSMVFGNLNENSATGVVFSRCPSTGTNKLFGEFLINAQGEDIVAGTKTPMPIMDHEHSMQKKMPVLFDELQALSIKLEKYYSNMQDIEFTIEDGKLYILQTRDGKRSINSAIKIAIDMVNEGLISKEEAILRIDPESVNNLLHASIDYSKNNLEVIAKGLPASPGAATGIVVFSAAEAEEISQHSKVILVRNDTSPEDIKGMHSACGIMTSRGGMTSHAAVVTRGMGKPCVCGISEMIVDEVNKVIKIGSHVIHHGEVISIDGSNGKVFLGAVSLVHSSFSDEFKMLLDWANEIKDLEVRTNAESVEDAAVALKFGAKGIGLCRSEHMFFSEDKISLIREMIITTDNDHKENVINQLLIKQTKDFKDLMSVIEGHHINIRLLDPPLHEFLPHFDEEKEAIAKRIGMPLSILNQRLEMLNEVNPMLGHRGCRLGISNPDIYKMQIKAILSAASELKKVGKTVNLEIMIPFISNINELRIINNYIQKLKELYLDIDFSIGSMIELPRAVIISDKIAQEVDFFCYGSNDLTQTTYGISRDDISSFLPSYISEKIFDNDPFICLDEEGVGHLIKTSATLARSIKPNIKLGVCGEHAGNPQSIRFFDKINLDYISCSPYRVPIAIIAAAQAKIINSK